MKSELILNIGCGDEKYGDVRADIYRSETTHVVCDAHFLPFKDCSFSKVYSKNLFEHLRNPFNALKEQKRILKPLGRIFLITDNASFWKHHFNLSMHVRHRGRGEADAHYALYLPLHLVNFFDGLGMHSIEIGYLSKGYGGITGIIRTLLVHVRVLNQLVYTQIKIVAQK